MVRRIAPCEDGAHPLPFPARLLRRLLTQPAEAALTRGSRARTLQRPPRSVAASTQRRPRTTAGPPRAPPPRLHKPKPPQPLRLGWIGKGCACRLGDAERLLNSLDAARYERRDGREGPSTLPPLTTDRDRNGNSTMAATRLAQARQRRAAPPPLPDAARTIGYARVSTEEQSANGQSLAVQEAQLRGCLPTRLCGSPRCSGTA